MSANENVDPIVELLRSLKQTADEPANHFEKDEEGERLPCNPRTLPVEPPDPGKSGTSELKTLVDGFRNSLSVTMWVRKSEISKSQYFKAIQKAARETPAESILYLLAEVCTDIEHAHARGGTRFSIDAELMPRILTPLIRKQQSFSPGQMSDILKLLSFVAPCGSKSLPWSHFATQIENHTKESAFASDDFRQIAAIIACLTQKRDTKVREKLFRLIRDHQAAENACGPGEVAMPEFAFQTDEPWIVSLQESILKHCNDDPQLGLAWRDFLDHASLATTAKPNKRWLKQAGELLGSIENDAFIDVISNTLSKVGVAGPTPAIRGYEEYGYTYELDPTIPHDKHVDLLRGLCWSVSIRNTSGLVSALSDCAAKCYIKIRGFGPRSPKVGNACVTSLSMIGTPVAVAQLSRLNSRVKHASVKKQISKALDIAAEAVGLTRTDLEELSAPRCDFTSIGILEKDIHDFRVRVTFDHRLKPVMAWTAPSGKQQKSIPKTVKEACSDDVKSLKANLKLSEDILANWRSRIESYPIEKRTWNVQVFRERFSSHPILGVLVERLLWMIKPNASDAKPLVVRVESEQFVDVTNDPVSVEDDATIELWHPIFSSEDEILAWRELLAKVEITQPFKQAHREIYRVTDAERATGDYSNRFASHVLRQHQFKALADARGWRYTLEGGWDGGYDHPKRVLEAWGLRVEFWCESIPEQISDSGIFLYLTTDQTRYYPIDDSNPIRIEDVEPLPLSETMRDIDLFVGVASIGSDPNWRDSGDDQFHERHADYWNRFSFGDLSESGKTRSEVLRLLIPRLKIASQCEMDGRFLVVHGSVRTYKIHVGSSNILMSPDDQYLCIVPDRSTKADAVALPFEGDRTLSLILSKAFLLAADDKITDRTILSQINRY